MRKNKRKSRKNSKYYIRRYLNVADSCNNAAARLEVLAALMYHREDFQPIFSDEMNFSSCFNDLITEQISDVAVYLHDKCSSSSN